MQPGPAGATLEPSVMSETEQRRLAAIMFTDMVGYSALAQRNDALALELLEEHRRLLRGIFPRFHGVEIKTIGDAFLVEFNSALEAAQCAIEIQRCLSKRNHDVTAERWVELKIGIHIGDVVHRDGDVYGDGVNIASRIEALAGAGGICVSLDVERQVRNALEARFERLGLADLKNVKAPMELFRIVLPWEHAPGPGASPKPASSRVPWFAAALAGVALLAALGWWFFPRPGKTPKSGPALDAGIAVAKVADSPSPVNAAAPKSVAVLPFANLSTEKENEYFADGLHDDVITSLAKIRDLTVISRTSVLAYRDTASRNLKKIAADLGVATVLEGSVRRVGAKVHMNAQLIDARTDTHLWADTFDGDTSDIFALQARLAQQIASALKATLSGDEQALLTRRPTRDPEAYDLYMQAKVLEQNLDWASRSQFEPVLERYDQAAARDPRFALPHVRASMVHGMLYWFATLDPTPERRARAQAELETAQRLAPGTPEVHLAQGDFEYRCRNDWAAALAEFQQAEAQLPNDADLQNHIGLALRRLGHLPEALERFKRAAQLDPNSFSLGSVLAETPISLRRFPEALANTERYLALFPKNLILQYNRAQARLELDGDLAAYQRALAQLPVTGSDPFGLQRDYFAVLSTGDLAAVEKLLSDPRLRSIPSGPGTTEDPVDLHRAQMAWLRGHPEEARTFADAASAAFRAQKWVPRQEFWVKMGLAECAALAGRIDDGLSQGKAALDAQMKFDAFDGYIMRALYTDILVICGRRDEALASLKQFLAGPTLQTPREIQMDPFVARLKDDPRFEELFKSVKPL